MSEIENQEERETQIKTEAMKVSVRVTGHKSLRNTPNKAARREGGGSNLSASPEERRVGRVWTSLHTHTHRQTHTDAFPCKQLGYAGRLGGRM